MEGRDPFRPDDDLATIADAGTAVRAPSDPAGAGPSSSNPELEMATMEFGPDTPTLLGAAPRVASPSSFASGNQSLLLP